MSYLRYLCLFGYSGVEHKLCFVFCFVFVFCPVYTMLSVSLDCRFLVAPIFNMRHLDIDLNLCT